MKNILTIHEQDLVPTAPDVDVSSFRRREAARAIVKDSEGKIALLKVGLYDYHKLPGGGIDVGEDMYTALERELQEEIGCKAEISGEVGQVVEYLDQLHLMQTSYCFVTKLIGEKGEPHFTEKELREQFSITWADNIDSAIDLIEQDQPANYEGKFIQARDVAFLKAAKEL